jgi:hypothetical protein
MHTKLPFYVHNILSCLYYDVTKTVPDAATGATSTPMGFFDFFFIEAQMRGTVYLVETHSFWDGKASTSEFTAALVRRLHAAR